MCMNMHWNKRVRGYRNMKTQRRCTVWILCNQPISAPSNSLGIDCSGRPMTTGSTLLGTPECCQKLGTKLWSTLNHRDGSKTDVHTHTTKCGSSVARTMRNELQSRFVCGNQCFKVQSGPIFARFFAGPRPDRSQKFPEPQKTRLEPVKTDENRFKPVQTSPGINVLKHSLNQIILQMFVNVNCRPLFYVYFKPLTIQMG